MIPLHTLGSYWATRVITPLPIWEEWEDSLTGWTPGFDGLIGAFTIVPSPYGTNGMQTTNYTPGGVDGFSNIIRPYQVSGAPIVINTWRVKLKVTSKGTEQFGPAYTLCRTGVLSADQLALIPVTVVATDADQRASLSFEFTDHFLGTAALPLNTWVEIVVTVNYLTNNITAVVNNLDTPGVISTDTFPLFTTELPFHEVRVFQGSLNGGAGDLTPMTVISDDIDFVRRGNTTPTPFVSYTLNAATAEFGTLLPVSSLLPTSTYTWNGPGGGSYFVTGGNESPYSLAEYVTFPGDYLEISLVAEPGAPNISASVRINDMENNGWSLTVENNIGTTDTTIFVYEWIGGTGNVVASFTLASNWTAGIKETKIIDDGINCKFYFDGTLVFTTVASILPFSGTLWPLGKIDVTSTGDEKIYSATVVG